MLEDYQNSEAQNFQGNGDVNVELNEVEVGVSLASVVAVLGPEAVELQEF